MTHTQVVTAHRMAGSVIPDTQLALAIIIPMLMDLMPDIADQIRLLCKSKKERRIAYIIFDGRIASAKKAWAWRPYEGSNKHNHHCHISFEKEADNNEAFFQVPMLGATE